MDFQIVLTWSDRFVILHKNRTFDVEYQRERLVSYSIQFMKAIILVGSLT